MFGASTHFETPLDPSALTRDRFSEPEAPHTSSRRPSRARTRAREASHPRDDELSCGTRSDPAVLRLENYDTEIPPHPDAIEVTRAALGRDDANSYLPFSGLDEMKEAVADLIARRGGAHYDPYTEVVITDGDGSDVLNSLFVLTDRGDEVILTDPTYAGMLQRVRLVGAVPKLVPLHGDAVGWRLDLDALGHTVSDRTRLRSTFEGESRLSAAAAEVSSAGSRLAAGPSVAVADGFASRAAESLACAGGSGSVRERVVPGGMRVSAACRVSGSTCSRPGSERRMSLIRVISAGSAVSKVYWPVLVRTLAGR